MDGAIVLDRDVTRILRAATQLVPDPSIETSESGTRHRTAERVAIQTGFPVVSVSQSMQIIALYVGGRRHVARGQRQRSCPRRTRRCRPWSATSAASTRSPARCRRWRSRTSSPSATSPASLQRLEMVRRISEEIADYVVELGTTAGCSASSSRSWPAVVGNDRELVIRDYLDRRPQRRAPSSEALDDLDGADRRRAARPRRRRPGARVHHRRRRARHRGQPARLPAARQGPRGCPGAIVDRLVDHFGSLQKLLAASIDDLMDVDGVGEGRARAVREGLSRLAESSILERYV